MATYINGVEVPANLSDTEFGYWCQAQDAKRDLAETKKVLKWVKIVAAVGWFGVGLMLTGCSTIMNDRITDVSVLSEPSGQRYSITDEDGKRVHTGTTPDQVNLDAAAGFFDGQTYQVAYEDGKAIELDSHTSPWYWVGFIILPVTSAMLIDPISGDMFSLPAEVSNVAH